VTVSSHPGATPFRIRLPPVQTPTAPRPTSVCKQAPSGCQAGKTRPYPLRPPGHSLQDWFRAQTAETSWSRRRGQCPEPCPCAQVDRHQPSRRSPQHRYWCSSRRTDQKIRCGLCPGSRCPVVHLPTGRTWSTQAARSPEFTRGLADSQDRPARRWSPYLATQSATPRGLP